MNHDNYVIRGGIKGRERLRILARVMNPTTLQLFEKAGIQKGMTCLDVGCGGGDVSFDLGKIVGPAGKVTGIDIDETKIEMASNEAKENNLSQVEFFVEDILEEKRGPVYDVAYARFLLTHLSDPLLAMNNIFACLKPGGIAVIEDIDFRGHFCHPENEYFNRYVQLYTEVVFRKGADPNIGPRLPGLLLASGFEKIEVNVIQPAGFEGEVKWIAAITMENIADAVIKADLASKAETEMIIHNLYELTEDGSTYLSLPRIVQTWGMKQ